MGKLIGGMLLIVGTSIGAGILALPVSTSEAGFIGSSLFLLGCWMLMTFCAFLILEVNLWLPQGSNMISMAKKTLGPYGAAAAWFVYLLLLYSLLCAYVDGGTDVFTSLLHMAGLPIPEWGSALIFTIILGYIVYLGTRSIDYANRALMFIKLGSFFVLLFLVSNHIKWEQLLHSEPHKLLASVMLMITSFGYATILPSLRTYFNSDVVALRKVVILGSLVPLICYILWELVILGSLPLEGDHGLIYILKTGHTTSELMAALDFFIHSDLITDISRIFISISVLTSFLGVALSLSDFLSDGLKWPKQGFGNIKVYSLTFIPPFIFVIFYPTAFILALKYAGVFCILLLGLLPVVMAWRGRYHHQLDASFRVPGGKVTLLIAGFITVVLAIFGLLQELQLVSF
ncbi:MAG: tryptophan/tyrosine permease [Legionellales bacterium]|nr:tryptophan/tyrosine permease [Legionellales bacterium]|tara:strand:- start:9117 stop:10322 length:1206 start_codon:yes stop_codon:yes gene_type:complete